MSLLESIALVNIFGGGKLCRSSKQCVLCILRREKKALYLTEASQFPDMSFVFARGELTLETSPWLPLASHDAFDATRTM